MEIDDMWDDEEDRDISLSLAGKVEKQEPVLTDARIEEIWYQNPCSIPFAHAIENEVMRLFTASQPCLPASVFVAGNRVSTVIFASRKDADAYVASVPASAGVVVSEVPLVGTTAPCPECEKLKATTQQWREFGQAKEHRFVERGIELAEQALLIKKLKAERDELAARVEKMRTALGKCRYDSLNMSLETWREIREAANLPDLSTGILNRHRAELLQQAVDLIIDLGDDSSTLDARTLTAAANAIRALAADMEEKQ